jgi:hypothetical protein
VAVAQREVIDADHVRRRTGHKAGQAEDQPQRCTAIPSAAASRIPARSASSSATWGQ